MNEYIQMTLEWYAFLVISYQQKPLNEFVRKGEYVWFIS